MMHSAMICILTDVKTELLRAHSLACKVLVAQCHRRAYFAAKMVFRGGRRLEVKLSRVKWKDTRLGALPI